MSWCAGNRLSYSHVPTRTSRDAQIGSGEGGRIWDSRFVLFRRCLVGYHRHRFAVRLARYYWTIGGEEGIDTNAIGITSFVFVARISADAELTFVCRLPLLARHPSIHDPLLVRSRPPVPLSIPRL